MSIYMYFFTEADWGRKVLLMTDSLGGVSTGPWVAGSDGNKIIANFVVGFGKWQILFVEWNDDTHQFSNLYKPGFSNW